MSTIKLQVGEPVTLTVTGTAQVEGNFGPQVKFDSDEGTVYLKDTTADQQLGRLGLDRETVVGETITIEKVEKNGRTFTNISRAGRGSAAPSRAPQPLAAGGYDPQGRDFLDQHTQHEDAAVRAIAQAGTGAEQKMAVMDKHFQLHAFCLDHVLVAEVPKLVKAGVPVTTEGIAALCNTLYIELKSKAA